MEKLVNFVKGHPVLTALVAVGVLLLFFWPSSGGNASAGGTTDSTAAAAAVSAAQNASAQIQLSADQVRAIGLQAASAEAMNASDNAAAVSIANIEMQGNKDTLAAALATSQATTQAALETAKINQQSTLFGSLASAVTTTQAQALAKGQATDAAGFGLMEMFKNLLNADKGIAATQTAIVGNKTGASFTVYESGSAIPKVTTYTKVDNKAKHFAQTTITPTGSTGQIGVNASGK